MVLFRNTYADSENSHLGYEWFRSAKHARWGFDIFFKERSEPGSISKVAERLVLPDTRDDAISFLNRYAGHADNG